MTKEQKQEAGRPNPTVAIYKEAAGAHATSKEILSLILSPGEGKDDDPMEELLLALKEILDGQAAILRRLDQIEKRIAKT